MSRKKSKKIAAETGKQVIVKDALDRLAFDGVSEAEAIRSSVETDFDASADVFSAFYRTLVKTEEKPSARKNILDQMLSLPEYSALHQSTRLDDVAAALATAEFSKTVIEQIQSVEQRQQQQQQQQQQQKQNDDTDSQDGSQDAGEQSLEDLMGEQAVGAMRSAMRRGLQKAEEKAKEWNDAIRTWGIEPGELKDMSGPDRMALASQLLGSRKFKGIAELVGRFKNIVQGAKTMVYSHGSDEIVDITTGSDLHRLLPSELLKLKTSPTEFYRAYLEGRCLQYNLRGEEQQGKGPILVALDVSGSMDGWREQYSRALTLALMSLAKKEGRAFGVIFFDAKVHDVQVWPKASQVSLSERLALINRPSDGGGTDFAPPLQKALEIRNEVSKEMKPADLVFITDGECSIPSDFLEKFNQEKKACDLRVYGLGLGVQASMPFCDSTYSISDSGGIEAIKAIEPIQEIVRKASQRT